MNFKQDATEQSMGLKRNKKTNEKMLWQTKMERYYRFSVISVKIQMALFIEIDQIICMEPQKIPK